MKVGLFPNVNTLNFWLSADALMEKFTIELPNEKINKKFNRDFKVKPQSEIARTLQNRETAEGD